MNVNFVDLKKNYESIKCSITEEFNSLFDNCDFINGKKVGIFENNFAEYLNIKHFIGCANGTDALEIAVKCLDLEPDDEVIVQGNTYIATCLGVVNNNIKLVLCDVVKETHMIDIEALKQKITSKTKAIIVVHLYGLMPNMDKILDICKDNNLHLIEDCAQAHGALWNGKKAGSFGDLSCFSFYPGKNLGAYGDGGGIGTNNDLYNEKIRKIINIGSKIKYHHEMIGRNSRLDTLQASFLNVKLEHLDQWNSMRRTDANIYADKLAEVGDLKFPVVENGCTPVYHLYVIRTKHRDALKKFLDGKKIQCLIHYPISVAETEAMKQFNYDLTDLKNCIDNSKEILSLPMFPELEIHEIDYICNSIKQFFIENNLLEIKKFITENKTGSLYCINNINFAVKRFFYINFKENVIENQLLAKRGFHANTNFNEFIVVLEGSIHVKLIDTDLKEEECIVNANETFYIPSMKWVEYNPITQNTILLCLVDKNKSDSVSINDFNKFKELK
jgi:dTDP-4-amino-4,6-dideoxygalactose transaminase